MPTITRKAKAAVAALGLGGIIAASTLAPVNASSHREAPLIAHDPAADNTDVYAFMTGANSENVTLIANYIPLQDPFGGPNYFFFGDDVLYSIHVDNDGDAIPNITYEFRFTTENAIPGIPVYTSQQIDSLDDPWNLKQTYSLSVVEDGKRAVVGEGLPVPPVNVGPRTTPNYSTLALSAVRDVVGGAKVFAGQRDEAFPVDLGSIFDLLGLRPFDNAHIIDIENNEQPPGVNSTEAKNVHSLALEVPKSALLGDGPVLGIWATASRQKVRVFNENSAAKPVTRGRFVQVSRLGNPLVNEVVIPISLKDVFNTLPPRLDSEVLADLAVEPFATEGPIPLVTDPILADLLEILYEGVNTPPDGERTDLVKIFLTGIDQEFASKTGLPVTNQTNGEPAEMLRLNTDIANSAWPNGRALTDDVVDTALRAVAGAFFVDDQDQRPFNIAPNNALGDGVSGNDMPILDVFPYIPHPHSGYDTEPLGDITTNSVENDNL